MTTFDIHCTYLLYMLMYVSVTYLLHVLFLFSLYAYAFYYVYAIYYFCFTQRCFDEFCLKCFKNTCCQSLLAINSLIAKFFKSLYYDRFYCIQQVNMSWVFYDFSHISFVCYGTYVSHLLGTYVTILCNCFILWQNALYLYIG